MHTNCHFYAHNRAFETKLIPNWIGDTLKYTLLNRVSNPRDSLLMEISLQVSHDCNSAPHSVFSVKLESCLMIQALYPVV